VFPDRLSCPWLLLPALLFPFSQFFSYQWSFIPDADRVWFYPLLRTVRLAWSFQPWCVVFCFVSSTSAAGLFLFLFLIRRGFSLHFRAPQIGFIEQCLFFVCLYDHSGRVFAWIFHSFLVENTLFTFCPFFPPFVFRIPPSSVLSAGLYV